jgi:hypothetical protein
MVDMYLNLIFFPSVKKQSPLNQGLLITEASRSHPDTSWSEVLLWNIDQSSTEDSI